MAGPSAIIKGHGETATYRDTIVGKDNHSYATTGMTEKHVLPDVIGAATGIERATAESVVDAEKFVDKLLSEANVFITPGFIFGSNGEKYLRVSLCNSMQKLEEAIRRVKNMFSIKANIK